MPPTFAPAAVVPQMVAASALSQLNRFGVFTRAATGNYEPNAFERGDAVTFRRARIVQSQDYDPRSGIPAVSTEPGYASNTLTLERLWTAGFPVFGHDNRDSITRYVNDYGEQIAAAITTDNDDYFYNKFRTVSVPSTGIVAYGSQPPVTMVAATSKLELAEFNKQTLINANTALNSNNVPAGNRFAILSSAASGGFLGDSVLVEGFGATSVGAGQLLQSGMSPGIFVPRYGFMCSSSNAVSSQSGVAALDGASPDVAIASVALNPSFIMPDYAVTKLLGAVDITVTATALTGVAIGQIAKIAPASEGSIAAFGLILRVAGNVITIVPFAPNGQQVTPARIIPGTHRLSIPSIPSISVAYHRESLLFATRLLNVPSEGSGATMFVAADRASGLVVQVFQGQYRVDEFRESQRYATLIGATLSDQRKACLILSL